MSLLCKAGIHRPLNGHVSEFRDIVSGKMVYSTYCPCGKKWLTDSTNPYFGDKVQVDLSKLKFDPARAIQEIAENIAKEQASQAICKGSINLGTACGKCPKCYEQQAEMDAEKCYKERAEIDAEDNIQAVRTCRGSIVMGSGCGRCAKCHQEQRDIATLKERGAVVNYIVHVSDANGKRKMECNTADEVYEVLGTMALGGLYEVESPTGKPVLDFVPF